MRSADQILNGMEQEVAALIQRGLHSTGDYDGTFRGVPGPVTTLALAKYLARERGTGTGKTALIEACLEWAKGELGTKESGGNNRGPQIEWYQKICYDANPRDLGKTGWPWCAAFMCRMVQQGVLKLPEASRAKVPFDLPTTPAAFGFATWALNQPGVERLTSGKIQRGDIVIFKISHIEVATSGESGGYFKSIGGNTSSAGGRDGDGVWEKTQRKSSVRDWVRFSF